MKKFFILFLTLAMIFSILTGCGTKEKPEEIVDISRQKVAFITDIGDIDDHGYNQYTYEGVVQFAEKNKIAHQYYKPAGRSTSEYTKSIEQAIADGNTIVVMAGFYLAKACYLAAVDHPEVLFLALDITMGDMGVETLPENLAVITYKDEQTGFLAGYAAVMEGYKELGFLGGVDMYAVVHYGYGFIQGAEMAAADLGIDGVNIKYWYSNSFMPNRDITEKMISWYDEGTEVIFACGGAIYESCLAAADKCDGSMIGVDVDQSYLSDRIITSAIKSLSHSVMISLTEAVNHNLKWPDAYAGKIQIFGAKENCIGLPMENSYLKEFDEKVYTEIYQKLVDGTIVVDDNSNPDVHPVTKHITVDFQ